MVMVRRRTRRRTMRMMRRTRRKGMHKCVMA
jgi:hypothetical protein